MTRVRGDPRRQSTYQTTNKRSRSETQTEQTEKSALDLSNTAVKSNRRKKAKLSLEEDDIVESHFHDTIDAKLVTITETTSITTIEEETNVTKPSNRKKPEAKQLKSALKAAPQPAVIPEPAPVIVNEPASPLPQLQKPSTFTIPAHPRRSDVIDSITKFYQHELAAQLSACETVYGVAAESQPHSYLTAFAQQVSSTFLSKLPDTLNMVPLTIDAPLPPCQHEQSTSVEYWRDAVMRAEQKLSEYQAVQHSLNQTFINATPPGPVAETDIDVVKPTSLEERSTQGYDVLSTQIHDILDRLNFIQSQLDAARNWRIQTVKQAKENAFGRADLPTNQPSAVKELVKQMAQPH